MQHVSKAFLSLQFLSGGFSWSVNTIILCIILRPQQEATAIYYLSIRHQAFVKSRLFSASFFPCLTFNFCTYRPKSAPDTLLDSDLQYIILAVQNGGYVGVPFVGAVKSTGNLPSHN